MRALLSCEPGGPDSLKLLDVAEPVAGPRQVVVAVKACGVNYPDLLTIQDLYQVKTARPFAPGAEIAGVVTSVGPEVGEFAVGDRVAARIGTGGMAEAVAVDVGRCAPISDGMSFVDAAVMQFTFETALYALRNRAGLQPGETALILGAGGGVGIAAVQVARNLGARVIAAASSEKKLDFARSHGAADGVLYPAEAPQDRKAVGQRFKEAVGGGADVVIDPVGGWLTDPAIRCVADGGRYVVLGFTAGIPSLPLNLPLLKNCDVLGVNWRTFTLTQTAALRNNKRQLERWYAEGRLSSGITAEFALAEGGRAIQRLADRSAVGKVVVVM
ncbi:NADPH:quinone oxidoreductase family protein [Rhodopseudomonas palustris]|uniref:NADPH:quinone oxidoreductase family protein n=1 Tax=Rhodopseudomonas palustris TaxID=1076 RepID=A0A323UXG7_RHOPL|nr:NADPH:quinone oxidoreductase family protein [Rhodopseudomonas palustris]PZA12428.1 NADPH:quinone oxidoreductase family protein [Rhodopseudomonas palustris]